MMRFFKPGTIILLLFYIIACGKDDSKIFPENITIYEINPLDASQYRIHDVVSNYEFISLEVPNDVTIEEIRNVIFRDSKIYVWDSNRNGYRAKISVYDSTGSFQFVIDRSGRGPGEYEQISDFNVTDNNIVVISPANILYYDRSTGKHVNTIENNFEGDRIQWAHFFDDDSGVYEAGRGRRNLTKNHLKFFETKTNSIIHEAVPFESHALILSRSRFLFETNEEVYARPVNSNIVYNIQKNQGSISVEPSYALDFGGLWIPESFLRTSFQNMDQIFTEGLHRQYIHKVDLFETNKFLYAAYTYERNNFAYIYDKETDQHINVSKFIDNEIGWPVQPLGNHDEWIIGVIYPFELKSEESIIDPSLQEIVDKSDNDGNPILVLVSFNLNQ